MIKFEKIWLEGFGSYIEETEFKLNRPGLNVIIADNGSGKTTLFSGLYWILYGKTLKDTKSVETRIKLRPQNYKGTKGRIKFKQNGQKYEIIRFKNYTGKLDGSKGGNRVLVFENGKDITKRDKRGSDGIQSQINGILGYSPDLFLNSIIFGQRLKRIIQESGPNKKKVFEEAFEASFINSARKRAEEDLSRVKDDYYSLITQSNSLEDKITQQKKLVESEASSLEDKVERLEEEIKFWTNKTNDMGVKVSKLENVVNNTNNFSLELDKQKKKLNKLLSTSNLKQLEDDEFRTKNQIDRDDYYLEQFKTQLKALKLSKMKVIKKCPRCGGKLDPQKIKNEKAQIDKDIEVLRGKIKIASSELNDTQARYSKILEAISSNKKDKEQINILNESIKRLETKVINEKAAFKVIAQTRQELQEAIEKTGKLKKELNNISKDNLIKANNELKEMKLSFKKVKKELKPLSKKFKNLQWLVGDALSNKGLKSYIFDTMLTQLNNQLKYYTQFIGMRPEFNIDFDSANKDLYAVVYDDEGDMKPYEELSGGEAQMVDVVTAFGLHDITVSGRPCNLMVLDEVFEGLDEGNTDIVLDLIQDKAKDKSLFLISHNSNLHNSSTKVIKMHKNKQGQTILKLLQP